MSACYVDLVICLNTTNHKVASVVLKCRDDQQRRCTEYGPLHSTMCT